MVRAWQTGDNLGFSAIGWPARSRLRSRGSELTADLWWKLRHLHNFARLTGGVRHRIERTVVLNPGQTLGNLIPNHLIFDFASDAIVKEHAPASSLEADFDFRYPPENSRRL
jgi:hypothetical protein